jgi:hypothetical protein
MHSIQRRSTFHQPFRNLLSMRFLQAQSGVLSLSIRGSGRMSVQQAERKRCCHAQHPAALHISPALCDLLRHAVPASSKVVHEKVVSKDVARDVARPVCSKHKTDKSTPHNSNRCSPHHHMQPGRAQPHISHAPERRLLPQPVTLRLPGPTAKQHHKLQPLPLAALLLPQPQAVSLLGPATTAIAAHLTTNATRAAAAAVCTKTQRSSSAQQLDTTAPAHLTTSCSHDVPSVTSATPLTSAVATTSNSAPARPHCTQHPNLHPRCRWRLCCFLNPRRCPC